MGVLVYKTADVTVANIGERNAITNKIDNMVVTVLDAIGDPDAGTGVATYRWNEALGRFILISRSSIDTMSFDTQETLIVNGEVAINNVPVDNKIWEIYIVNGNVVEYNLRLEDITVGPSSITGLDAYNGKTIRFTYAYGTISQQIETYLDSRINELINGASVDGDTLGELEALMGTVSDFEGALA